MKIDVIGGGSATAADDPAKFCFHSNRCSSWSGPPAMEENVQVDINSQQEINALGFSECRVGQS